MAGHGGITRTQHDALLAAFRERPGTYSFAADRAGVDEKTAKKAWLEGWPNVGNGWARPLRVVLAEEAQTARDEARIAAARAANLAAVPQDEIERAKAKLAAVQWHVREGELAHGAIVNAGGLLGIVNALLQAAVPLAQQVKAAIEKEGPALGARAGAQLLREIGNFTRDASAAAKEAVELERLHLGQPGQIVGVADATKPMTLEEAAQELADGARTLERAKRRGIVKLTDGSEYLPPAGGGADSTAGTGSG